MPTETLIAVLVVLALLVLIVVVLAIRQAGALGRANADMQARLEHLARDGERLERELREALAAGRHEAAEAARAARTEQAAAGARASQTLATQMTGFASALEGVRAAVDQKLSGMLAEGRSGREESAVQLKLFGDALARNLAELRGAVEARLAEIAAGNEKKLEEMRVTVDEKLQKTLEGRLAESFKLVSERLEQVHRGLGEMQNLAAGVGDLKRVLSNVKTRGVLGEMQLVGLLEQILVPGQYAANVATRPGSSERVEFAIRLPGRNQGDGIVWLPIDAKFPLEDYERLAKAQEAADLEGMEVAGKALETRIRLEARAIAGKYLEPPATTDFALLYLPFEGLYAEVLRRPGLFDGLQRECRVIVCGPTTLNAILNSLQMGFRTLAIEQRSSEVWKILGEVKGEFAKFGEVLARTKKKLEEATNTIGNAEVRTRVIERKLRDVEALPSPQAVDVPENEADGQTEPAALLGNVVRLPEER
jgi:DNA recombination protein RmuC